VSTNYPMDSWIGGAKAIAPSGRPGSTPGSLPCNTSEGRHKGFTCNDLQGGKIEENRGSRRIECQVTVLPVGDSIKSSERFLLTTDESLRLRSVEARVKYDFSHMAEEGQDWCLLEAPLSRPR